MNFIFVRESLLKQSTLAVRRGICQCNILSDTIKIVSLVASDLSEVINLKKGVSRLLHWIQHHDYITIWYIFISVPGEYTRLEGVGMSNKMEMERVAFLPRKFKSLSGDFWTLKGKWDRETQSNKPNYCLSSWFMQTLAAATGTSHWGSLFDTLLNSGLNLLAFSLGYGTAS